MPRYLITSALPYINGVKHLGNLIGSMLPADVYARFLRQRGDEVLFICATDEHGTPAELAAREQGVPVAEYCRRQHALQADLCARFGLTFDFFGRSSSAQNHELTKHFARRLEAHGFIEERVVKQVYSVADQRFLPDRYLIGTCPHCGYEAARGDQCESCTKVLDPTDLINPRSAISGGLELEQRETRHLFLRLTKLAGEIRAWVESHEGWPLLVNSTALKWLNEGLQDRGITRDLEWGVPVERPGFEAKVFYVWFDAPIAYIGATYEWASAQGDEQAWRSWWYDPADVHYVQFMAKDNLPFHTITWPATLLGSREPWKQVDYIKGFNWLTYYGGKFSTSSHRGVFMDDALALLPADYWRYYLVANAPESSDADFTWELFAATLNSDLADTFGNYVNRTLQFARARFGQEIPGRGATGDIEHALVTELVERIATYNRHLSALQFRKAAGELKFIWGAGNNYLSVTKPWKCIADDPARAACIVRTAINLIRIFALLSWPLIPETSEKLYAALRLTDSEQRAVGPDINAELAVLEAGRPFDVPEVLFRKITDDDITGWIENFSGSGVNPRT